MIDYEFSNREEASQAAAERIVELLDRRLVAHGQASLVVSGGTSPVQCFSELAKADTDWSNVHVVLSDERWVSPDHADSNERLVRENLLTGCAASAELLSVYRDGESIDARCTTLDAELRRLPFPFASALLGMGEDGHFASLFPDFDDLESGLELDHKRLWLPVRTAASPHPRVTLTLSALSRSDEIILLIFGDSKLRTLESAAKNGGALPVSRLLFQKRAPVRIYWAP